MSGHSTKITFEFFSKNLKQPEPGLSDNRQDIANMLAFRLLYFGYNDIEFTDVLSSGCWCNMINNYDKRKGHPVGTMDTACRAHSHCYKCINMDFECTAIDSAYQVKNIE